MVKKINGSMVFKGSDSNIWCGSMEDYKKPMVGFDRQCKDKRLVEEIRLCFGRKTGLVKGTWKIYPLGCFNLPESGQQNTRGLVPTRMKFAL